MNDYWAQRVLENENKAQRYAAIAVKRQEKLYRSTYKQITKQIDDLALELLEKGKYGSLSRSELWQYKKYIDMQNSIGSMFHDMSEQQITITTDALRKCFESTIGTTLDALNPADNIAYSILNKQQVD